MRNNIFGVGISRLKVILATAGASSIGLLWSLERAVVHAEDSELELHPPTYAWTHRGKFQALDINSVRRGYQVYKQVCAACHGLEHVRYLHMADAFLTEAEAKAEAAEHMYKDGPDENGNMFERPGTLTDHVLSPYANVAAAKAANNGAAPPDLSLITLIKRHFGGEDYVFSLLTGYEDAPAGIVVGDGQAYNPFFPGGGLLAMAQQLFDEGIEYEDGTPATQSQQAKDVTTFLQWCALPHEDGWKLIRTKFFVTFFLFFFAVFYMYRHVWATKHSAKLLFLFQRSPFAGRETVISKMKAKFDKPQRIG